MMKSTELLSLAMEERAQRKREARELLFSRIRRAKEHNPELNSADLARQFKTSRHTVQTALGNR